MGIIMRRDENNCATGWKNYCIGMKKIMHRDGKNSAFTAIFHPIAMHSTELSHEAPHALKGQKLLAQGSALGNYGHKLVAL